MVALVFVSLIDYGPHSNNTTPLHVQYKAGTAGLSICIRESLSHFLTGDEHLPSGRPLLLVTSVRLILEARLLLGLLVFGRRCVPALGGDRRESGKASCLSHRAAEPYHVSVMLLV